jgi:signal transduction histidine kinase
MWYTYQIYSSFTSVLDMNLVALKVAQELDTALVMQKGFVSYYLMDGNPDWFEQLKRYQNAFEELLKRAREGAATGTDREVLNQIELEYIHYTSTREQVIHLCRSGEKEAGLRLLFDARSTFSAIHDLCERYKGIHEQRIDQVRGEIRARIRFINTVALIAMPGAVVLGILLTYILLKQVLGPIRQMAMVTDPARRNVPVADEVKALRRRVRGLIQDMDQTYTQLEQSRERLVQSEKWAMLGKLAAGVAHSIRNPLTSVKMRLFSMERTIDLSETQKEDFEVISEEIRHIDNVVRNFLEFSRPPKLKMQKVSPSAVVDMALQLLRHRLESYGVDLGIDRQGRLPEILADPEQLKEVFVNLVVNACEAMGSGGVILVSEQEEIDERLGKVVVIQVSDNGPGIPQSILDKVFQPFFSTKEEGTGLGLSIATRIVEEHGGWMDVRSQEGEGATFIITLPCEGG